MEVERVKRGEKAGGRVALASRAGSDILSLNFYVAKAINMGITGFASTTASLGESFLSMPIPVIHNYPLVLALKGYIAEESYVSAHNVRKRLQNPASLFAEYGVYAYPLSITREFLRPITLSLSESDVLLYKPQTRLAIPVLSRYQVLLPGTEGETIIISDEEQPKDVLVRLGIKRAGVWRLRLFRVSPRLVSRCHANHPFNVQDSRGLLSHIVVLHHYAGDIALEGEATECIEMLDPTASSRVIRVPVPALSG